MCLLSVIFCMNVFAQESNVMVLPISDSEKTVKLPVGNAEYIQTGSGELIKISDLMYFSTQENADAYMEAFNIGKRYLCNGNR